MKKIIFILAIIFIVRTESNGQGKTGNDDFITVDVRKNYSTKKELILQDFMDVEYIALETNDDFINQGVVMDIGEKFMIVRNRIDDGDIFLYERNGKALRKINRKGQGPEEYIRISDITVDENTEEIFVHSRFQQKIFVYDLFGKYKRGFKYKENLEAMYYTEMFNYDKEKLICYDSHNKEFVFVLISKKDGSIIKEIKIPFEEKKLLQKNFWDGKVGNFVGPGPTRSIIPNDGNWILIEHSSDTVYTFSPDYSLRPFIVRTPSVQSMDPEVILSLRVMSDRYYFMETIKNEFDFNTKTGFPKTYFMYDKQEKSFSGYTVYNGDYSTKNEINMIRLAPLSHEIESWQPFEAYQLVESYKKGELKEGKLKEIASKLNEEDNPVIMLIKHKK